jgi:long-chain acyl-CoA synthetase
VPEYAVPGDFTIADDANLTDIIVELAANQPDRIVFERKIGDRWEDVPAKHFATEVTRVAAGLIAAGITTGDRVGLMSGTRYEWTLFDYAIWAAGAVTVPIYETSAADQIEWIVGDSEAVAVIVETASHRAAYDEVATGLGSVRNVWTIEAGAVDELTAAGTAVADSVVEGRRREVGADDLATIIYTSGTTGRPKGCELTHRNFLIDATATTTGLEDLFGPGASTLLFLPLAHVFARVIQVGAVQAGVRMGHTSDIKNLMADLAEFKPTFLLSVPRVFEKVYNTAKQRAQADGKGAVFDMAERVAIGYSRALDNGWAQRTAYAVPHAVFDKLVYSKLRAALGGHTKAALSGGAPLGERLAHFFRGCGLPVFEGYGLTESTAGATLNLPGATRIGTVGRPIPGTAVRIADNGEVMLHGDHIFAGYFRDEAATRAALGDDGWFRTGDIGELDDDGYLTITGRKKEMIVTAAGKNVAPAPLEDQLRAHHLISQCMLVGDRRPFIAAIVTIDEEALPAWKQQHGKPADATVADLVDDPDLRGEIEAAITEVNRTVSRAEAIKSFRIAPDDWTVENGQLTPSLKVKRAAVIARHGDDIERIYAGHPS